MKYYKHKDGRVFAFEEDGSQDKFITKDMKIMSDEEYALHIKPREKTAEELKLLALQQTEDTKYLARKLEEVIDHIENGTPLPDQAREWVNNRKNIRGE